MHRILIIENEQLLLWAIKKYLGKMSYKTFTAKTEAEALEVLQSQPIDLVVADLILHDISGAVIIKEIRRLNPYLPIIVITSSLLNTQETYRIEGLANALVKKPIEMQRLGQILREQLLKKPDQEDFTDSEHPNLY